jgi:hypothetical protein
MNDSSVAKRQAVGVTMEVLFAGVLVGDLNVADVVVTSWIQVAKIRDIRTTKNAQAIDNKGHVRSSVAN